MNLKDKVQGITLTKACSFKADKDSDESKQVMLEVSFEGVLLEDVFAKAVSSTVIQWQNGPGRVHFTTWKNGQTVKIQFKAPGIKPTIDPITAVIEGAKAAGMSLEAYVLAEAKKRIGR